MEDEGNELELEQEDDQGESQEVEANLEFVDKVITDRMDLSLNAMELLRRKAEQPEELPKQNQHSR